MRWIPSFFFQAEDGIRVRTVTGVQTCAIPIWPVEALHRDGSSHRLDHLRPLPFNDLLKHGRVGGTRANRVRRNAGTRSEERRVGKEGGSGLWPDCYEEDRRPAGGCSVVMARAE